MSKKLKENITVLSTVSNKLSRKQNRTSSFPEVQQPGQAKPAGAVMAGAGEG